MLAELKRDRIRTLRAVATPGDPLALRIALERALGSESLHDAALPPTAIVCVRRLRVPFPHSRQRSWSSTISTELHVALQGCARPCNGPVPADAPAVRFDDEAELLACLARDWIQGRTGAWWWRALFSAAPDRELVQNLWARAPVFVPGAIELLARMQSAVPLALALSASFCRQLADALAAVHHVPEWNTASGSERPQLVDRELRHALLAAVTALDTRPLDPPRRTLLQLALVLRAAPAVVHARGFTAALRAAAAAPPEPPATAPGLAVPTITPAPRPAGDPVATGAAAAAPLCTPRPTVPAPANRPHAAPDRAADPVAGAAREAAAERTARAIERVHAPSSPASPDPESEPAVDRTAPARDPTGERMRAAAPHASQPVLAMPTDVEVADASITIESRFAGAFYLVNLALRIELYGDFTQPARPGLALPVADFLAMVVEQVCGDIVRANPLWPLLARLSARAEDAEPGASADLPAGWLPEVVAALANAAADALELEPDAALRFLCERPGRIMVTATRVNVIFPLAGHPLAIRLSGLDRDPGWVPAAGRVIGFHYVLT